jgi:FKBP-type peptidyl-prolyl cis-trans isomerase
MNYDEENSGQIGVNFQRNKSGNSWLVQCCYKGTGIAKRLPHSEVGLKAAIKDRTLFEKDKESYMVAHFGAVIWLQKESARAEKKKAAETKRKAAEKKKAAETKPKKRKAPTKTAPATKTKKKKQRYSKGWTVNDSAIGNMNEREVKDDDTIYHSYNCTCCVPYPFYT